jgi:hypothetical protein
MVSSPGKRGGSTRSAPSIARGTGSYDGDTSSAQSGGTSPGGSATSRSSKSGGSSVRESSVALPAAPTYVTTSKTGNAKPKTRTDGTIRYGLSCVSGEPENLQVALKNSDWKKCNG